jgi:AraC-like DNA-binding protein
VGTTLDASARILRHDSDLGSWEMALREPDPRLKSLVHGEYCDWFETRTSFSRRRELPYVIVPLILNFGPNFGVSGPGDVGPVASHGSFAAGLFDSFVMVQNTGASRAIQVNLTALGARRVLGLPMHELTNRTIDLQDVLGDAARLLLDRLQDAPDGPSRFALLDEFFIDRITRAKSPPPAITWAWQRLASTGGTQSIGELAAELRCSRRHLVALFREHIGLPPKSLARILRFGRAVRLLDRCNDLRWSEVALSCGYYDQSHMNRDFLEFAGTTPTDYIELRLPDGGVIGD